MAAGGGGGGAWKVAYADFVTAMMALFMVLWISAQDKKILIATSRYFQNPFDSPMKAYSGVMPFNKDSQSSSSSSETEASGSSNPTVSNKQIPLNFLNAVAADFYRLLHLDQDLNDKPIDVQVSSDGLRITVFDRAKRPVFADQSTELTEWGKFVLQTLAWMIERHKFGVTIDGHTRSNLKLDRPDYTAWELSADRANTARRVLVFYAVDESQIQRVTGYADTRPVEGEAPDSPANQRITLSLSLPSKPQEKQAQSPATTLTVTAP